MKQSERYTDEGPPSGPKQLYEALADQLTDIVLNAVCSGDDNNFVVINQKGIDPPSLDLLARAEGAGAFEVAVSQHLINNVKKTVVQGRAQLGVQAFADALLVVPKTFAENSGLDTQDVIIALTVYIYTRS
ncbi:hypothetical protein J5N97_013077 [Dioscorea zingiberensis]|uniref:T-complex protein 1 subunit zeta n=1 Tax=Dioscorea zingiberensis TaxID=325984 RepID=A0A9D5CST5_9LILI|nr:hypothetical protein J5N97_013077 [Dioscorea zingiberensis]